MRYKSRRHYDWSDNIAYSVGLIVSDGCLQSDGRHIDLTSSDRDQLEAFSRALARNFTISTKKNGDGKICYRIQFSDVAYYDFLIEAGLTPRKSKTVADIKVPDQYYSHFLRGVFDGDGTTYAYYDARWKNSYMFYTALASASIKFLQFVRIKNSELLGTSGGSLRKSGSIWILSYAKKDSVLFFKGIYPANCLLFLERKKSKLALFINTSENVKIS